MWRLWRKLKKKEISLPNRKEICISGSGGQGIILAGMVLAEAIALYEDKDAIQTQSYGPEARGGACRCDIIISEEEIDYPKTLSLDILIAMTQQALDKNIHRLKKEGRVIADSLLVKDFPSCISREAIFSLPLTELANTKLGNIIVANFIALGAFSSLTGWVKKESLEKTLEHRIKKKFIDLNKQALALGFAVVEGNNKNEITGISS